MLFDNLIMITAAGRAASSAKLPQSHEDSLEGAKASITTVPQYFQTSPELWAGPTATGRAPFLAQTNPVSFAPSVTFVPNTPLETAVPIVGGKGQNQSIFEMMGQLSPYHPNHEGFGVAEYPLPEGADIIQVQVSHPERAWICVDSGTDAFSTWFKISNFWRQRLWSWSKACKCK
jgi:hypothetical protein